MLKGFIMREVTSREATRSFLPEIIPPTRTGGRRQRRHPRDAADVLLASLVVRRLKRLGRARPGSRFPALVRRAAIFLPNLWQSDQVS
jgi:hypothetical protein